MPVTHRSAHGTELNIHLDVAIDDVRIECVLKQPDERALFPQLFACVQKSRWSHGRGDIDRVFLDQNMLPDGGSQFSWQSEKWRKFWLGLGFVLNIACGRLLLLRGRRRGGFALAFRRHDEAVWFSVVMAAE